MPNDTENWVERPLTMHEGRPLSPAALCPACRQVRPTHLFRRYLTPSEARAHGYSGHRRVEVETAKCKDCNFKRGKPLDRLTNVELRKQAQLGDINVFVAETLIKRREQAARREMAAGARKAHEGRIMRLWEALLSQLDAEVQGVYQQQKYARRSKRAPEVNAAVIDFCTTYLAVLRKLRSAFYVTKRRAQQKPEHAASDWHAYITPDERTVAMDAWHAIPYAVREQMRPPVIATTTHNSATTTPETNSGYE